MPRAPKYKLIEERVNYSQNRRPKKEKHAVEHNCYSSNEGIATQATSFVKITVENKPTTIPGASGDELGDLHDPAYLQYLEDRDETPKRKRTQSDDPLALWVPQRDLFLQELINIDGCGDKPPNACPYCSFSPAGEAKYECVDCMGRGMRCAACLLRAHAENPLHRIQIWNGLFFATTTLKSLGLRFQLGHRPNERCPNPQPCAGDDFTVIDQGGIHSVGIDFCGCGASSQSHVVQLLRARLYPATVLNPKTAATFRTLKAFELLSYESKVSVFQYYNALTRLTDNTGLSGTKDRYESFLLMIRQWRHLKMLKRAARGHELDGIATTKPGSCAVECPACPHPDKNMPHDWRTTSNDKRWLHALFVGLDANFRLKRKDVSSESSDPDLGNGFAYIVQDHPYKQHLEKYKNESEPKSDCSRHNAIKLANLKSTQGLAATGVGTVECTRHDMKRPCSVGDLQVGERYCNMDYLFYQSTVNSGLSNIVVSYDIACQWSVHLKERMRQLDHEFFLFNNNIQIRFFVPKFHLPAHVIKCRSEFSFNYGVGVGRTDGEAPERGWAEINPLASSTKEMGPGSRRDALDSHFGDYNWRKVITMGRSLLRKFNSATADMADHCIAHYELTESLPPDLACQWSAEMKAWEVDKTKANPFFATVNSPTQAAVRLQLAQAESNNVGTDKEMSLDDRVSPSVLISCGIDIEAEQRSLNVEASKLWEHAKDRQRTNLQLRSNALQRKIATWSKIHQLYIPNVDSLSRDEERAATAKNVTLKPYTLSLWLPSQIGTRLVFDTHLAEIEWKLRVAQAHEALDTLRSNLQIRSYLYKFKDRFVRGQNANTRARASIETVQTRIQAATDEYRAAHKALQCLSPLLTDSVQLDDVNHNNWHLTLLPLEAGDIRELSEADTNQVSEGRRKISWIWKTLGVVNEQSNSENLRDALRIEWCKSHARSARFSEEVDLLKEEMDRVLRYLNFRRQWWMDKRHYSEGERFSALEKEGLIACATRQANTCEALHDSFTLLWRNVSGTLSKVQADTARYSVASLTNFKVTNGTTEVVGP